MNKVKKGWNKTKGYKTKSGAILYLLFQLFKSLFPETLNESSEEAIKYTIDLIILTGGADWIWRNRKKVFIFIKDNFKKISNLVKKLKRYGRKKRIFNTRTRKETR